MTNERATKKIEINTEKGRRTRALPLRSTNRRQRTTAIVPTGREDDDYDFSRRGQHASFFSDDTASNVESGGSKVEDDELSISKELNLKAQLYAALEGGDSTSTSDTSRPNSRQHTACKRGSASSRPNSNASKSEAIDFAPTFGEGRGSMLAPQNERLKRLERGEYSRKDGTLRRGVRHKRHGREPKSKGRKRVRRKEWLQVKRDVRRTPESREKNKTSPSKEQRYMGRRGGSELPKAFGWLVKVYNCKHPSSDAEKKSAVEGLKTAHRINPSPITKTEDKKEKGQQHCYACQA